MLHSTAKANNIPLNDDEDDDNLDDDMEEVDYGVAGNGFALRKTVTKLHC